jgi:thioredoxin reductase (NADPH)
MGRTLADVENVIIIGSGPAGYTAALYTARANLEPLVIEGFLWGGLLQQTTDVENYPGYPQGVMGPQMMQDLRDQAERFGTRFITENATRFEPGAEGEPHTVYIDDEVYKARAVVLAMGAEHKKLGVPGEEELGGRGISYCATCDAAFFKDRATIIVGGGDSAMEEAIFLAKFSSKVVIVHRRDEFRASKIMLERARATENIEFKTPFVVEEFLAGESGALDRARLRDVESGETEELPMDGAFIAIGHEPQSEIVQGIVETDDEGYVVTEGKSTRTNVPGVFAAGDLVDHTYRQAITAAGSGCMAALDAEWYLRDNPAVPTPAALEGTGDLAEEQWVPRAATGAGS